MGENEFSTTFWDDFSIADAFGVGAIKDTYNRAFKEWKSDYRYLTDLVIVLNHKCWYWYGTGMRGMMCTAVCTRYCIMKPTSML